MKTANGMDPSDRILAAGYSRLVALVIGILHVVGTAAHLYPATQALMIANTAWFMLACDLAVAWPNLQGQADGNAGGEDTRMLAKPADRRRDSRRVRALLLWAAGTWLVTFSLEALGVATGQVFGKYAYGPTLGLSFLGVPLVIALNRVMIVYGSLCMVLRRRRSTLMTVLMTGAMVTMFDWIKEPVAIRLGFWAWAGGDIPLRKYLVRFVIASLAAAAWLCFVRPNIDKADDGKQAVLPAQYSPQPARPDCQPITPTVLAGLSVLIQAGSLAVLRVVWSLGL
jgi:putative membrane protein